MNKMEKNQTRTEYVNGTAWAKFSISPMLVAKAGKDTVAAISVFVAKHWTM
jgi:hypothetical protein